VGANAEIVGSGLLYLFPDAIFFHLFLKSNSSAEGKTKKQNKKTKQKNRTERKNKEDRECEELHSFNLSFFGNK